MSSAGDKPKRLTEALEDHSAEGAELLLAEPSKMMRATILLIGAMLIAALIWSMIGRADVIVTATGTLGPESEVRRFYAPIAGEMVDIYIAEGQPVEEGDVLARINARGAVEVATNALDARLKLAEAERQSRYFPERKGLMERQAEVLDKQIEIAANQHEKRVSEGMAKLADVQKAKLVEARGNLETAARARDIARRDLDKFQRLIRSEGGGGVSRKQVEERRSEQIAANTNYELAEAKLGELEFQLSEEFAKVKAELEGSDSKLLELRIQHEELLDKIEYEEFRVRMELKRAELAAEAASRVNFDNIDEENFLRIVAPVSGVITDVALTQAGDKVQPNTPLGGIAPQDARTVLNVEIPESERAFLRVGQEAKLKFNAFPFQRYGYINGKLEYISPSTRPSVREAQVPVYEGRVSLEKDYFTIAGQDYSLRYGMEASAEITVRQRRLIDFALDPFRELAG